MVCGVVLFVLFVRACVMCLRVMCCVMLYVCFVFLFVCGCYLVVCFFKKKWCANVWFVWGVLCLWV